MGHRIYNFLLIHYLRILSVSQNNHFPQQIFNIRHSGISMSHDRYLLNCYLVILSS